MSRVIKAALAGAAFAAPVTAANNDASQMPTRILAMHNAARAQAGVAPLAWDPALGDAAARYAVFLAATNSFQHSDRSQRPGIGENLWMGTRGYFSYEDMIGRWVNERRDFMPGVFPSVSRSGNWENVGHYTQMVWPTTTRVGCAVATNARNDFLVCRYSPAGNVTGRPVPYVTTASVPPTYTRGR
jgi:hypothetical protein